MTALVWFRNDLRVADNPALAAASKSGKQVVAVYILNNERAWPLGAASRVWLHESLSRLGESLLNRGITLLCERGQPEKVLARLGEELKISEVHWNREYDPDGIAESSSVKERLGERCAVHSHAGGLLVEPFQFLNKSGEPYKVFTPFYKSLRARLEHFDIPSVAGSWKQQRFIVEGGSVDQLNLLSGRDWEQAIRTQWRIGEANALESFDRFIGVALEAYRQERDFPAQPSTSQLSPHLHFGELSVQRLWTHLVERQASIDFAGQEEQIWSWLRQLVWREFSHHLLYHFPASAEQPLNARFVEMAWSEDTELLSLWRNGRTGYPLVDAGMRQLWHTGWMHNRVRMVVASFLTKHLGMHWLQGARWFWDTLIDADLANNTMGWQWVAGCGADAAPYYRIFNPTLQSQKFDAGGSYIRHWVPELGALKGKELHEPAKAVSAGLVNYPLPCVDHREARQAALDRYQEVRG